MGYEENCGNGHKAKFYTGLPSYLYRTLFFWPIFLDKCCVLNLKGAIHLLHTDKDTILTNPSLSTSTKVRMNDWGTEISH